MARHSHEVVVVAEDEQSATDLAWSKFDEECVDAGWDIETVEEEDSPDLWECPDCNGGREDDDCENCGSAGCVAERPPLEPVPWADDE